MTVTAYDLLLYAGALFVLFLTPGPVWVALLARSMTGGFHAAWPLAIGVAVGDILWPLVAVLGVSWLVSEFAWFMDVLRWVAVVVFVLMGVALIRSAGKALSHNNRLTRPGMWAGFVAGLAVIIGNPKAALFYMGILPGFFDLTRMTVLDIAAICTLSFVVPLIGNLVLGLSVDRVRGVLKSPKALRRMNLTAGWLLIGVGAVIALT
ncbi:Threonine/homoserine/homoserine lactone efflux protein [Yoonia tamlensis]|uniref:Threonine/homoserine/homoserine lactone efflux protein n=1 Tax=Yoonia tamlensis TaxID=390270 RepID=A0A1I6HAP8_9RHOB|nr:LysE family translocator [Yoonia tamlensis]SFR51566.1 Threonine/homoserine/homoserine lactone efflux protein [Yoonia tamlensis]